MTDMIQARPTVLVGCPIWRRIWALPKWFSAVEDACIHAGIRPAYIFVGDPRDEPTQTFSREFCRTAGRQLWQIWAEEDADTSDQRQWNQQRYERMVYLRNLLLEGVRSVNPHYFLSVDSDVFLHPQAIALMGETIEKYDAVGGKCYMSPEGTWAPSYAMLDHGSESLYRPDQAGSVFRVDVIMALKLMSPRAYGINYRYHQQGEDIGWSIECKKAGLRFAWDGRVINKHAMSPEAAEMVDQRCGF